MCDESIWGLIGGKNKFCSHKLPTETQDLCKNENNVTGICEFASCPLANNKYATVREIDGRLYLFKKEPEYVNLPIKSYEKILLNSEYDKALLEIDEILKFWDPYLVHKCKQRLGKLTQYLIRKHELMMQENRPVLVARRKKAVRIEQVRGRKLVDRLDIEKDVKEELQMRLEAGIFGESIKEKVENDRRNKKIKNRRRIFIAEFEESDDYYDEEKVKTKKKEKIKLKW